MVFLCTFHPIDFPHPEREMVSTKAIQQFVRVHLSNGYHDKSFLLLFHFIAACIIFFQQFQAAHKYAIGALNLDS